MLTPGEAGAWTARVGITWPTAPWARPRLDASIAEAARRREAAAAAVAAAESRVLVMVAEAAARVDAASARLGVLREHTRAAGRAPGRSRRVWRSPTRKAAWVTHWRHSCCCCRRSSMRLVRSANSELARADLSTAVGEEPLAPSTRGLTETSSSRVTDGPSGPGPLTGRPRGFRPDFSETNVNRQLRTDDWQPITQVSLMRHSHRLYVTAAVLIVLAATAFVIARGSLSRPAGAAESEQAPEPCVCPMHPDVHQDHPGRCPICGMALEKVSASEQKTRARRSARRARGGRPTPRAHRPRRPAAGADAEARAPVTMDGRRQQLIGVRTVTVTEQALDSRAAREGHRQIRRVALDGRECPDRGMDTQAVRRADGRSRAARDSRCWRSTARSWPPRRRSTCSPLRTRDRIAGGEASTEQADRLVDAARQRLARWDLPTITSPP